MNAELLIMFTLDCDRAYLYAHPERELTSDETQRYDDAPARHELALRIKFQQADLLEGLSPASFDFVVSNPPYVGDSEEDSMQLEVRKFEPRNAVFAGPTGLEIIDRLIPQAESMLIPDGWL